MARSVTVELLDVYLGGDLKRVVIREPKMSEFIANGDPVTLMKTGGSWYTVENDAAIQAYLRSCIVEPESMSYINNLSLADAMRVKEAMLSFFSTARERLHPTAQVSSSTSDGVTSTGQDN